MPTSSGRKKEKEMFASSKLFLTYEKLKIRKVASLDEET